MREYTHRSVWSESSDGDEGPGSTLEHSPAKTYQARCLHVVHVKYTYSGVGDKAPTTG